MYIRSARTPSWRTKWVIVLLLLWRKCYGTRDEVRCKGIDIRNAPKTNSNLNCTIVEGNVLMSMITADDHEHKPWPVFPHLREITGNLILFHVHFLTSLGKVFPNLRVIGGDDLVMNYALVIYQTPHIKNVGLNKLTLIKNGGVRIADNNKICFTRYINWEKILYSKIRDVVIEKHHPQCPEKCAVSNPSECEVVDGRHACWSQTTCQKKCEHHLYPNNTFGPGCSESGERCHDLCLGGCFEPNDAGSCFTCKHVEIGGICVQRCPPDRFEFNSRTCVTKSECESFRGPKDSFTQKTYAEYKAFNGICHYACPEKYKEDPNNNRTCVACVGHCPKICRFDGLVDSTGASMKYKGCKIVQGNLEIEIRVGNEAHAEKFTEAFSEIEEITGYLMIRFSSVFVSLHMFKNLQVIKGEDLYRGNYSIVVLDNQNLRELFPADREPIKILNGKAEFHNNRMLCYKKIVSFLEATNLQDKVINEVDIGQRSNGDKAVCEEVPLEVEVSEVTSTGFSIRWKAFSTLDMDYRKFIGYQIFYKKVTKIDPEISIDADRSACADTWRMTFADANAEVAERKSGIRGSLISSGIEPNSLYAFYVQTKIINHDGARNAISKVFFVRTHFGEPEVPRLRDYDSIESDGIAINFDPPGNPRGIVTHYRIEWEIQSDTEELPLVDACRDNWAKLPELPPVPVKAPEGVCLKDQGCCDCSEVTKIKEQYSHLLGPDLKTSTDMKYSGGELHEQAQFENAIQDRIFVQQIPKQKRTRRSVMMSDFMTAISDLVSPADIMNRSQLFFNVSQINLDSDGYTEDFKKNGQINITGRSFIIRGLSHFTQYQISIYACQDVNAPENFCSKPTWFLVRTGGIPEKDVVNVSTVRFGNITKNVKRRDVYWEPPADSNGPVLAYKISLKSGADSTPMSRCINVTEYERRNGTVFYNLPDGDYDLSISTVTHYGTSQPLIISSAFKLKNDKWSARQYALFGLFIAWWICFFALLLALKFQRTTDENKQKLEMHNIVMNPEYLSQMDVMPTDDWEIKREDLEKFEQLGKGMFGVVYKGKGNKITSKCGVEFGDCAIKEMSITDEDSYKSRLLFLMEANAMKDIKAHYVVQLYGVVTSFPSQMVLEYMPNGNLKVFISKYNPYDEDYNGKTLSQHMFFKWAAQIADGMSYLENIKFVHRDLAARNVLVAANFDVKVSDFGFARDVYDKDYYRPHGNHMMPVKWMSPEALKDYKYTSRSDVWSYGVVLYEMCTLGSQPYVGLSHDMVVNYVLNQKLCLAKPHGCVPIWYALMRTCWRYDPNERPFFWEIVTYLKDFLSSDEDFKKKSFVLNSSNEERTPTCELNAALIANFTGDNNGHIYIVDGDKAAKHDNTYAYARTDLPFIIDPNLTSLDGVEEVNDDMSEEELGLPMEEHDDEFDDSEPYGSMESESTVGLSDSDDSAIPNYTSELVRPRYHYKTHIPKIFQGKPTSDDKQRLIDGQAYDNFDKVDIYSDNNSRKTSAADIFLRQKNNMNLNLGTRQSQKNSLQQEAEDNCYVSTPTSVPKKPLNDL